ncbi:hypothetical protein TVAG_458540 [Trichomonas vaginalis G3]|uniref:Uncharacterized protein n=1 Tax=Trichomonas vaginalis (strain ATCC PRA-98 / G3) TaxID=412133 RepID=A2G7M0_TRIV3|nr:hypothetical protein TVAGG3_0229630 [Trichomonas vaginalis G3]EAX86842.1 hypothetical protein TVAG_458540 [Trichomonas vaginalis G3]KAI5552529.1 hypothetical protein TVAGG3_0229630 [Trichomonas vaginalis G3]|eukprot:XP_001299772.1 hypothetical protein [Trichomonas vaginalis G3]
MRSAKRAVQYQEEEEEIQEGYEEEDEADQQMDEDNLDDKDAIIARQKKMIQEMRKNFVTTIDSMRSQLNELIDSSTQIQTEMLQRIKELKAELEQLRKPKPVKKESQQSYVPKGISRNVRQSEVRSSLYDDGPKHPRKLASQSSANTGRSGVRGSGNY